jgi:TPR repeat protein
MYEHGRGGEMKLESGAANLYQRGCDHGDPLGCANLGRMYEQGLGDLAKDADRAAALYRQACDRGDATGCAGLKRLRR